ncbi:hypothetical protein ACFVFI_20895 [Streptomyces sp. NPDC057705]|uniref:hypothetical protein n=1 Tax=Streptomyces sp. NPDC057705 TaxID=3346222 RepID=UPI0036B215F9
MQNLARAVLVLFGLLVLVTVKVAMSVEGGEPSVPLTAQDVTGTWQGDRGGRLEVLADGRVRLTELSGWPCTPGPKRAVLTGEGGWIIERHSDEDPGIQILIKFPVDGTPAVQACDNWFTLHGTGKGGASGDGSSVWASFLSYGSGSKERFRRTATG